MNNLIIKIVSVFLFCITGSLLSQESKCFAQERIRDNESVNNRHELPGWLEEIIMPESQPDSLLEWKLKVVDKELEIREKSAVVYSDKDVPDVHVLISVWYIYSRASGEAYLLKSLLTGTSKSSIEVGVSGFCNVTYKERTKKIVGQCWGSVQFNDKKGISRGGQFSVDFRLTP